MAVYQFSALSDGQAISFDPSADVLNFDQAAISAAGLRAAIEGGHLRLTVASGTGAGKDVLLLNVAPTQLALSNITFANGSRLQFGDGAVGTANDNFGNTLGGTAGADHLAGLGGNDNLSGGSGNDWLEGGTGQDVMTGGAGADSFVFRDVAFNSNYDRVMDFASGTDKVLLHEDAYSNLGALGNFSAGDARFHAAAGATAGHDADDRIIYNTSNGFLFYDADGSGAGRALFMGIVQGAPTLVATDIGVFGDSIAPPSNTPSGGNDSLTGSPENDSIDGLAGNDTIDGLVGNDLIIGGEGNDSLIGGAGADRFVMNRTPGASNTDVLADFVSAKDRIVLDGAALANTGPSGSFSIGDGRFRSGFGTTSAQDVDDRVIYNNSTGELFYDPDGNGAASAELIAIVAGAPGLVPEDFEVINGSGTLDAHITGTSGDDHLSGGDGNDTIEGFDGNDTLNGNRGDDLAIGSLGNDILEGAPGNDTLISGDGNDTLNGEAGFDSLDGGLGDDLYMLDNDDTITDAGGTDGIMIGGRDWVIPSFIEDAYVIFGLAGISVFGNDLDNRIVGHAASSRLEGAVGNDILDGAQGDDTLIGGEGGDLILGGDERDALDGGPGNDTLDGGAHDDSLYGGAGLDAMTGGTAADAFLFDQPTGAHADSVTDFQPGVDTIVLDAAGLTAAGPSGSFASGDARFWAASGATSGHDPDDRIVYNTLTGDLYYDADGSGATAAERIATLQGAPELSATDIEVINGGGGATSGDDTLVGTPGNDTIDGLAGNDSISGLAGDDSLIGGDGRDTLDGGDGTDTLDGGLGDDTYFVEEWESGTITDSGGIDTVMLMRGQRFTLGQGLENLVLDANYVRDAHVVDIVLDGNDGNNVIRVEADPVVPWIFIDGQGGADTLIGGNGQEAFSGDSDDSIDGGGGGDVLFASGDMLANPIRFVNIEAIYGGFGDDRLVADDTGMRLHGSDGDDTLSGGAGEDFLDGDADFNGFDLFSGNDLLLGGAGNDTLFGGLRGGDIGTNDTLDGGTGNDNLGGESGADVFLFTAAPGAANADTILDLSSGTDAIQLDATVMPTLGASGAFAPNDPRFFAGAGANSGQDASDRVVYDTTNGQLWYDADGNGTAAAQLIGTLQGVPSLAATDIVVVGQSGSGPIVGTSGDDSLDGTDGNDAIDGLGGNDTINGQGGDDVLLGGAGDDSLFGDESDDSSDAPQGSDTLEGGAGNDMLHGRGASDSLVGGDGNDTLDAGTQFGFGDFAADTLDGGTGDDVYWVYGNDDMIVPDTDGIDKVISVNGDWTLGAGLENLEFHDTVGSAFTGIGNELDNTISGGSEGGSFFGMGGNDVLLLSNAFNFSDAHGGEGNDTVHGARDSELFGDAGDDLLVVGLAGSTMTGGAGSDAFLIKEPTSNDITDFASGADKIRLDATAMAELGRSGTFALSDGRFHAAPGATGGHDADDRVVYDTTTGELRYDPDGSGAATARFLALLQSAPPLAATDIEVINGTAPEFSVINGTGGNDALAGSAGNDSISGFAGNDTLSGGGSDDWLEGGSGQDNLTGGDGADSLVFRDTPFNTNYDRVFNFASGTDELVFDDEAYTNIGTLGDFAAGDGRFFAADGASAGHDADDRIIYNTSNGNLYYDADGSGGARAMFVGVLHGGPDLDATDVTII